MIDCPRCDGGRGWSPHYICARCNDTGHILSEAYDLFEPHWFAPDRMHLLKEVHRQRAVARGQLPVPCAPIEMAGR